MPLQTKTPAQNTPRRTISFQVAPTDHQLAVQKSSRFQLSPGQYARTVLLEDLSDTLRVNLLEKQDAVLTALQHIDRRLTQLEAGMAKEAFGIGQKFDVMARKLREDYATVLAEVLVHFGGADPHDVQQIIPGLFPPEDDSA